jgi:glycosyltransferase involved in cell wall biosynthesis
MEPLLEWGLQAADRQRTADDRVFYLGAEDIPSAGADALPEEIRKAIALRPGAKVITFAGKFGEYYNPEVIVRAAARLQDGSSGEQRLFVLAGNGPYLSAVRVASAGLSNVIVPGWLGASAMAALLRVSHLFIVPCTKPVPAFPNKIFAYLSAGAPIISSVYGEFRDLISNRGIGANFEPGDDAMLASKISALLSNEEQRAQMGRAARRLYEERFNARTVYGQFADFLEELATRHGSSR